MSSIAALLWRGAALSTLFLYPLVSGLADNPFHFQWSPNDTLELCFSFGALSGVAATCLYAIERIARPHVRLLAALSLCALPFGSFATQVLRQFGLTRSLGGLLGAADATSLFVLAGVAVAALCLLALAFRHPEPSRSALWLVILVLSPLTLISAFTVARRSFDTVSVSVVSKPEAAIDRKSAHLDDIHVLVFDELDYDFLYQGRTVRSEFPNLRAFAASSDNYHHASSPGDMTLSSMPGLLMGRRGLSVDTRVTSGLFLAHNGNEISQVDPAVGNIFQRAHARGYRTAMFGWALPYCQMMPGSLDDCRSFSNYNYSSPVESFSPFGPIATTMILLPFQRPFGFLKSAGSAPHQRNMVSATFELAISALAKPGPLFGITHFSIPHDPFVFDRNGYSPAAAPFVQDAANYRRQLGYVDELFGRFTAELKSRGRFDRATVMVLSDHAYRALKNKSRHREIPLIVKRPHQKLRRDLSSPTHAEALLQEVVAGVYGD